MSAFAAALATLVGDPNLGVPVTYVPAAGPPVSCNAAFAQPDEELNLGGLRIRDRKRPLILRASDVPNPVRDDLVIINGETFRVMDASQPDPQRLTWRLELAPQL